MTTQLAAVPRISLRGGARERGRRYGEAAVDRIAISLACYGEMFAVCGLGWQQAEARAAPFETVIERAFPEALEEIHGIAEGAGVSFGALLALNVRTELLPPNYLALVAAMAGGEKTGERHANECTSFAISRSGPAQASAGAPGAAAGAPEPVWLAQNWDWLGVQRDALVLLEVEPQAGPRYLTLTEAGMLAKIGLNEQGLGVTLNILRSVDDGEHLGMPVHILLRALLSCASVEEALTFARAQPHYTASSNVMMADAQGAIASIEHSPRGVRVLRPEAGRLWHTNHFLDAEQSPFDANLAGNLSTRERLAAARDLLGADADPMSFADVVGVLSNRRDGFDSICRFPDPSAPAAARIETVASVIMNLATREIWVAPAQPSVSEYARHCFAKPVTAGAAASVAVPAT